MSFKKGDHLDPRNWRPISLLNVDYKIASRAIAGRLPKVIHLVVNSNQTWDVPGRYIGDSVAFLRDVVSYASLSGTPVAILSWIEKRLLTGWIGVFSDPLWSVWVLGLLLLVGLICSTREFKVL